ncbi:MAG: ribose-phosphate pyrophosphokinase [Lachnospiraceae bacterium]|jgi:ribose-phosphate pyrophosphokinase|uniref:ribose-phosphate pyrophosphokinase n=1 Tax=Candidatus Merdisoma sp. JLR.KK006 TaxID=3112626 RepID=UPI002FEE7913|nr:ribose-phosphate pyrophosphokinase [Lachnospiraceae bacterium]
MSETNQFDNILPVAPLKIAALDSCIDFAKKVNKHLVKFRRTANKQHRDNIYFQEYAQDSYLVKCSCPRFGTGEAKGRYEESVRGSDLFIMVDVCNYSITYKVCGHENHMSPDDHYQDLKRMISAATGKAHRINVVVPFLYEGRQHKRSNRESLDCAIALQELRNMGVNNIITFDAHDPRVQNAIPLNGFDNFQPPYQFIKALLRTEPELKVDNEHLMIIAPDEGAMERAVYFSNVLGIDLGMFYKRRDYSTIINGKNPIVAHEFLGDSLVGKDVIIIDDMISSGGSMLDVAKQMKERGAEHVYVCCTFGLFTDGFEKFDDYYEKGFITRIVTTNLNYRSPELLSKPYYTEADMTKFLARIIDTLNHDFSADSINTPTEKIRKLIAKQSR